ncbi:MAG: lactonase family protein [Chloroflexi bacterium]|nr:lactonase family protein [Chloroflexota bacterium]
MTYRAYMTAAGDDRIVIHDVDAETGRLENRRDVLAAGAPSPLATDPQRRWLFVGLRAVNQMASYRIERDGGLTLLSQIPLGSDPCYVRTDRTGRFLMSAYYGAGRVAVHPIGADGALGSEPIEWLATAPKAHCIMTDRTNRLVFVPHVEPSNMILQFRFDPERGTLTPNATPRVQPPAGEGPRHYGYHPTLDVLYFSNEQGCSITAYRLDRAAGTLSPFQTLPTLPPGFAGKNTCAQIHIRHDGRAVYVSNRGHDSIACYAIDPTTGALTSLGQQPAEPTPRVFGLDPGGRFLYAAGQGSGRVAAYRVMDSGRLAPLETYPLGERPMWVLVL